MPEMVVESSSSSPAPRFKISVASIASPVESRNTTTSSKITSSDKLSALPSNRKLSNQDALATSTFTTSSSIKRGWRRSFDGSDLHKLSHNVWGTPHVAVHTARFEPHPINHPMRGTSDQMSSGKETPRQRVSTESDRASLPAMRQAISRLARGSGPSHSSPPLRSSPFKSNHPEEDSDNYLTSRSPSQSKSRAASPLRMLHNWSSGFHRSNRSSNEEPFIPIDPFRSGRFPFCGTAHRHFHHLHDVELGGSSSSGACDCDDLVPVASVRAFFKDTQTFITDTLPRELYLNLLLRLPAMYFSRVARIFEDADVSRPDIQRMINTSCGTIRGRHVHPHPPGESEAVNPEARSGGGKKGPTTNATLSPGAISGIGLSAHIGTAPATSLMHMPLPFPDEWTPAVVSPALIRFKHSWEAFIDSLLREWKTLNVVSALLASAILTIFQIPEAAEDPVTRTLALLSLICALMSLSYGCMYIVRFGTMRSMFHASRWAEEAQKTKTLIWWNVWVLLATPSVWMAWSMLLFLSAILSFVWRTGSVLDPEDRPPLGAKAILGPRIAITLVFFLGIVYLALIVRTLKKYGSQQNAARALIEVGSSGRVDQTAAANVAVARGKTAKHRHDEIMERRGRERERSSLPRVRRREDTDTKGRKEGRKKTSGDPDAKVLAPKGVFGLVAIDKGPGARDDTHEFELQVDSKSFEDIVIQEMQV
ncbi:hypothetical protein JR316_0005362 [Psilocybe cubensis]|uniref:Uncharacterized protein n=1 Tax=Psilocybe cubensis TaxID=181762 RepID=A0ACB8H5H8_PSICU|nr:hypothetical protein JR316_0005362 [Psilocybe cubensis]KAH9483258.1 hypothetical protein JR316_0005362 [Psilocybe cubensis]